ncbi:Fic family protein [Chitinophaga cymbidii]|uniref:Cell division protein Fic n=1 Tax=Chitinophaga cymbidii TaxID=1096750 RepID=A0A512RRF6_9BACT|nr:Fic family protein [Chitinophaga cymbidii]GEP98256.1 cell division protein Fic [Chitinophaga cymbidii]
MIEHKIRKINTLKNKIEDLAPRKEWNEAFFEKVKIDFTYNSNKLEGNTLTYGQTIKLLKDFVTPPNAAPGELLDLVNHQNILNNVFANYSSQTISEDNIKALHKELMKDLAQWNDDGLYSPGQYKVFENYTMRSNGKIHNYLLPTEVASAMEELIHTTNEQLQQIDIHDVNRHPLTIATRFHQELLNRIHAFSDGNGRIGRLFTNLILLKEGYPPIFIKDVDREEYLKRFEKSDEDISPMLDFLADRLIESLEAKLEFIQKKQ